MSTVRVRNIAPHPAQGIRPGEEGEVDERLLTSTSFFERVEPQAETREAKVDDDGVEEKPKRTRRRKPQAD